MKVYYIWRDKKEIKMKRSRKRKKNKTLSRSKKGLIILIIITVLLCVVTTLKKQEQSKEYTENKSDYIDSVKPDIDVELLTPNEYSRPQIPIESVQYIAIHYTANPGATAIANRNYFENLATTHDTKVSSHFVVGLDGEVVQCIPTSEMSYATNSRNVDTLSIECCHPDETGKFYDSTYQTLVNLCAYLCVEFDLKPDDIIRHYDVTGKICPKYFVDHPEEWETFHKDVKNAIRILKK